MSNDAKLLTNFIKRVEEELATNGPAIVELLTRHGFTQNTAERLYCGDIEPVLEVIESVAHELGLRAEWLAYGIEPKQAPITPDPAAD